MEYTIDFTSVISYFALCVSFRYSSRLMLFCSLESQCRHVMHPSYRARAFSRKASLSTQLQ